VRLKIIIWNENLCNALLKLYDPNGFSRDIPFSMEQKCFDITKRKQHVKKMA